MKRWFILEGFYTSDSRGNPDQQPNEGLHVSLTCQQGNHPTGLTSALYSHATKPLRKVATSTEYKATEFSVASRTCKPAALPGRGRRRTRLSERCPPACGRQP
jgi:hypothetical protein